MKSHYLFLLFVCVYAIQAGDSLIIQLEESSNNNVQVVDNYIPRRSFKDNLQLLGKHLQEKCTITNAYRCGMLPLVGLGLAWLCSIPSTEQTTLQESVGFITLLVPLCMLGIESMRLIHKKHQNEREIIRMINEAKSSNLIVDDSEKNETHRTFAIA